jgi:hypothetical protein
VLPLVCAPAAWHDDITGVPASIDDGMKVARGVVVQVTAPLPVCLDGAVPALGTLCIDDPAAVIAIIWTGQKWAVEQDGFGGKL